MGEELVMSTLPKTWILDLDGTLLKHNGYKIDGYDSLLPGAREFLVNIDAEDMVIVVTSRHIEYKKMTEDFLTDCGIRFDCVIYDVPYGERILVNDNKPSGLKMAHCINFERDIVKHLKVRLDEEL